jgi:hypothetical protein
MKNFAFAFVLLTLSLGAIAQEFRFAASLDGSQETTPVTSTGLGWGTVKLNAAETEVAIKLYFSGLGSNQTMGHIHGAAASGQQGTNAPVVINIGSSGALTGTFTQTTAVTAAQIADLRAGRWYFNVHTETNPGGEIRGQILPELPYYSVLLSIHENPAVLTAPNASGVGKLVFEDNGTMTSDLNFEGLSANQTAAHIHTSTGPATNGPVAFNIGSQGALTGSFSAQSFTPTDEQINVLRAGRGYYNVHTSANPGGEIRGQILRGAPIYAKLTGAQEVPSVSTTASGFGFVQFNASETGLLASALYSGLSSNASVAHIHTAAFGSNGPVSFNYTPVTTFVGNTSGFLPYAANAATQAQIASLKSGNNYFNVHSANNPGGEIRGQVDGIYSNGLERKAFQAIALAAPTLSSKAITIAHPSNSAPTASCHESK